MLYLSTYGCINKSLTYLSSKIWLVLAQLTFLTKKID